MHQIENEFLKITAREYGAELVSVFDKKNKIEHLWQADEKYWGWHAPVLFPVVGRCLNDEIIAEGKKYPMEKHGFARKMNFKLLELGNTKMVFSLTHSADTLAHYPYRFEFLIAYTLIQNKLHVFYEVINKDDRVIYFQLGGHPAFAVPFQPSESYSDYYLEFEQTENASRYFIDENGFFNNRKEAVLSNSSQINLRNDLFKDDALIFKDLKSRSVTIRSNNHSHSLSVLFKSFNYLGLWAKVNAPYVCIEPWLGCADTAGEVVEFKNKEGVVVLPQGEKFNSDFEVIIGG